MGRQVILITGASSGFGAMTARGLATAGHCVYAGVRDIHGKGAAAVADAARFAKEWNVDLRTVELDVLQQSQVDAAVARIMAEQGQIDVVIHNAGHMCFGPAEAFAPEQLAALYDVNVLSTQRLNRAALPHMRERGQGLVVWVSSSSTRGGTPPFLGPYFAAKAAMDALAISYAGELTQWGIETTIVVPGAFTKGTNHFRDAGAPADQSVAQAYMDGPYKGVEEKALAGLASLEPADADPESVARAIEAVVDAPRGKRPFRVHVDPSQDGAEVVNGVADRMRAELLRRIGLEDLLHIATPS
ncbi:dehydrogenase [Acetobacter malorum DSM 14337]|uniref:Dehydrogenase n=1 Tax=Acetobacter malorum DSM 14337 TaxID=1307910 RepID=A0ABQ0PQ53_9PROT|nr:SDR family oxidoreductase [Acetobacter malorum]KXV05492.1 oxidoreductase [Acetobacter malorum]GBQ77967.1 dehydrogenase [Acetobacter malorum DSM 14337]